MAKLLNLTYTVDREGSEETKTLSHMQKDTAVSLVLVYRDEEGNIADSQSHGWGSAQTRMYAIIQEIMLINNMEGTKTKDIVEVLELLVQSLKESEKFH